MTYTARFYLSAPGSEFQKRGTIALPEKRLSDYLLGPHSYLILTRYLAAMTDLPNAAQRVEVTRSPGLALAWAHPRCPQTQFPARSWQFSQAHEVHRGTNGQCHV